MVNWSRVGYKSARTVAKGTLLGYAFSAKPGETDLDDVVKAVGELTGAALTDAGNALERLDDRLAARKARRAAKPVKVSRKAAKAAKVEEVEPAIYVGIWNDVP
jgi:hypothetical protein